MALEEAFGIAIEEDSAQSIATVQDAADLIEEIVQKSSQSKHVPEGLCKTGTHYSHHADQYLWCGGN